MFGARCNSKCIFRIFTSGGIDNTLQLFFLSFLLVSSACTQEKRLGREKRLFESIVGTLGKVEKLYNSKKQTNDTSFLLSIDSLRMVVATGIDSLNHLRASGEISQEHYSEIILKIDSRPSVIRNLHSSMKDTSLSTPAQ